MKKLRRIVWRVLWKRRAKNARRMLRKIDVAMRKSGAPRWERRQFWRDFIKGDTHYDLMDAFEEK